MASNSPHPGHNPLRPNILDDLSATQMSELEEQITEDDRQGFDRRAEAYGWPSEQAEEIWTWLKGQQSTR
jgi:hypothetical protein